jgi:hypothetical protein
MLKRSTRTNMPAIKKEDISLWISDLYEYGTPLSIVVNDMLTTEAASIIPYVDTEKCSDTYQNSREGYDFIGYGVKGSSRPIGENEIITGETELYAIFEWVSDITTRVHEDWFKVDNNAGQLRITPKYTLGGKITIPSSINGEMIKTIGSFSNCSISHCYFQDNNEITSIGANSFGGDVSKPSTQNLMYFNFEKLTSLVSIGASAF